MLGQLREAQCKVDGQYITSVPALVVLKNLDLTDELGVAFFLRFPFGHLLSALLAAVFASFRSRAALQLEILALRHQLGVLQRSVQRPKLTPADRLLWAWLCAVWNDWQSSLFIVKAATVIGWHRKRLSSVPGPGRSAAVSRAGRGYLRRCAR